MEAEITRMKLQSAALRILSGGIFAALLTIAFTPPGYAQTSTANEIVKIGYPSRGITELPLRIAQTQGFFQQERLDVQVIQMRANITIAALSTGDLDYGAPLDSIIRASARGQPLKAVVSFVNKPMHYLVAAPQISTVEQLRGRTIALNSFGSAEQLTCYAILKAHGIDPDRKEVQIVFLGDSPVRLQALKRGIVDATMVLIPEVILAGNAGFKNLAHAGAFMELSTPGLGTTDRLIKEKPDQVRRVVRAVVRSIFFIRKNKAEAVRVIMSWLALDRNVAERSYEMALDSFSEDGSLTDKGVATSIRLERERGGIKGEVALSQVFDRSFVREAQNETSR
jgi:NitT/TauT family transport system substrate-binding protein